MTARTTRGLVVLACLAMPVGAVLKPRAIDLCTSFHSVCTDLTSQVDCNSHFDNTASRPLVTVEACKAQGTESFVGHCKCANLDASDGVLRELVDYSVKRALPYLAIPKDNTTDVAATFTQVCSTFLTGAQCPADLQIVSGYGASGSYSGFKGDCSCGTIDASDMIRDALMGFLAVKQFATTLIIAPATETTVTDADNVVTTVTTPASLDLCQSFTGTCSAVLADMACPANLQVNLGCSNPAAPESLVGTCKCGALDASAALKEELVVYAALDVVESSKVYTDATATTLDFCKTFTNACDALLTKMNVSKILQESASNCVGGQGTNLATFRPTCGASEGALNLGSTLVSLLVAKSVEEDVPDLVCLGAECSPYTMSPGVMAILIISAVLAFVGLLTWAYQRGDAWAHAILSNPLVNRVMAPFTGFASLFSRRRAKESPADTHHTVHLRGTMA